MGRGSHRAPRTGRYGQPRRDKVAALWVSACEMAVIDEQNSTLQRTHIPSLPAPEETGRTSSLWFRHCRPRHSPDALPRFSLRPRGRFRCPKRSVVWQDSGRNVQRSALALQKRLGNRRYGWKSRLGQLAFWAEMVMGELPLEYLAALIMNSLMVRLSN